MAGVGNPPPAKRPQPALPANNGWTYAYNASDKLTAVQEYNTSGSLVETIDYKYDAFGEEIEQDVTPAGGSATATKFAYNGWNSGMPAGTGNANFQQWAILNGDNSLQTRNIDGNQPGFNLAHIDEAVRPTAAVCISC